MRNFWLVAKNEYRRTALRRSFLILTLAVPLGMALLIGAGILMEQMGDNNQPLGYVDQAGVLDSALHAALREANRRVQILSFADVASGQAAVERGEIQALFVFPVDYPRSLRTDLYYLNAPPGNNAWQDLDDWLRLNLVASLPPETQERLLDGSHVTVHDLSTGRTFSEEGVINIVLPFVATFFFLFVTMTAAGNMLGVVANEKENRTMEVMLTTVTPGQLIGGKTLGLLAASLTQILVYAVTAVVAVIVAAQFIPEMGRAEVPWDYMAIVALFFLPAFAFQAGLMVAIGAAATDLQQGQQVSGLLNLLFLVPLFVLPILFENPSSPVVVFMTLFPTTSFLTVSLRWGLGSIPIWQLVASWVLLVASALLSVVLATRVTRVGMLRYGQSVSLKGMLAAVRTRGTAQG